MARFGDSYWPANGVQIGRMRCAHCGKKIDSGEFRHREKGDRDVLHHRVCCADDPEWAKRDKKRAEEAAFDKARSDACREFMAKWDVTGLEDYVLDEPAADAMAFSLVAPASREAA